MSSGADSCSTPSPPAVEQGKPGVSSAKPLAPVPGNAASAELMDSSAKTAASLAALKETPAPSAPAAKAAAAQESGAEATGAAAAKAAAKPATDAAKIVSGIPPADKPGAGEKKLEKVEAPKKSEAPTAEKPRKRDRFAAGVASLASRVLGGVGSPRATAKSEAKAEAKVAVSPTSAAATMDERGMKPISAVARLEATGSVLSRGAGAQAEAAAPKAKAKAKAAPIAASVSAASATASATPVVPKPATASAAPASMGGAYPAGASSAAAPTAPASVLDIVTGTPQPVLESASNAVTARTPAAQASPMGPAKAYAKMAAPAVAAVAGATSGGKPVEVPKEGPAAAAVGRAAAYGPAQPMAAVAGATSGGKPVEVPKEGPAAVAVGRAVADGAAQPIALRSKAGGKTEARVPMSKKFQIVFVTGEVAPYSKTGGLGEAMDGLPNALAAFGHRVMVVSPRYDQYKDAWDTGYWGSVTMGGKEEPAHFFHTHKQKVDHVFVDHPTFLERVNGLTGAKLYGPEWGKDFADNQARYAYFCKAALVAVKDLPLGGATYGDKVVIVANDWHSALVPMFVHAQRSEDPSLWQHTKSALLCHNAVFQGRFEYEEGLAQVLGVPQQYIDSITFKMPLKVGKYNKKVLCVNTMAAGLRYSDRALTVSPSYAREVASDPEKGVELEELFALGRSTGILNGVKEGVSPAEEEFVKKTKMVCGTFTPATVLTAKGELKAAYRQQSGLPASSGPLMCFIGRLDAQKGYDLLLEALVEVLEETEMQVVIVGAGRSDLVQQTKELEAKFPTKFFYAGWMGPERYALLAGCDYTLLPSRWEPCGLVQMEAMRMGTLPIVAPTGGLRDTVEDGVNGLWTDAEMTVEAELDEDSSASIARALKRAAEIHASAPQKEERMMQAAMAAASEFTWSNAALQYEALFEELGVEDIIASCPDRTVTLEADRQVC